MSFLGNVFGHGKEHAALLAHSLREPSTLGAEPPIIIAVVGPPDAGKRTIVNGLHAAWSTDSARFRVGPMIHAAPRDAGLTAKSPSADWERFGHIQFFDAVRATDATVPPIRISVVPASPMDMLARAEQLAAAEAVLFVTDHSMVRFPDATAAIAIVRDLVSRTGRTLEELPHVLQMTKTDELVLAKLEPGVEMRAMAGLLRLDGVQELSVGRVAAVAARRTHARVDRSRDCRARRARSTT